MYYIVYEEYVDISGEVNETNDIYAIDVNTADLYLAYKVNEGKYNLQPFVEQQFTYRPGFHTSFLLYTKYFTISTYFTI